MNEPEFSDQEVREILEEAAAEPSTLPASAASGMPLAELKSVAGEAGIDPARIEEAARRRLDRPHSRPQSVAGLPRFLAVQRRAPGDLEAAHAADILGVIRTGLGQVGGEASEVAGALEWNGGGEAIGRHVTLSTREGKTTIRASSDLSTLALMTAVPTGVIGAGLTIAAAVGYANTGFLRFLGLAIWILPVLYLVVRFILGRVADSEAAKLDATADELARLLSE